MEIRVLGSVQVLSRGRSILRARRSERLLLGLLALEAGKPVAFDRLEYLLWPDSPPSRPRTTLQVYLSRLRSQLADTGDGPGLSLRQHGNAYRLDIDPDRVDALRFTGEVAAARAITDPAERAHSLRQALLLWRGPLLDDAADERLRWRLGAGLRETRAAAVELRIEADLEAGKHEELLAELADVVAAYPDRERLIAAHMTALYRCGRAAEALEVYRAAVAGLGQRLGLDVSDDLNDLYVAILRRDPSLAAARRPSAVAQLPADLSSFTGRDEELRRLIALIGPDAAPDLGRPTVCVIDGMAGIGKTALAVRAGHRIGGRFPDGQLYLDLHGFTKGTEPVPPGDALDRMVRALGVPQESIPREVDDRAAYWRSLLAERRYLIIFDNAASEQQVRPLLPAAPGCLVLVTSRRRLTGIEDAAHLAVPPLSTQEAGVLFTRLAGPERTGGDTALIAEVVELCGRLPLAVRIAASRLDDQPYWTLEHLAERLRDSDRRLAELTTAGSGVITALEMSYTHLSPSARRAFRLLGLSPSQPVDTTAAAALLDADLKETDALLLDLAAARLLQPCGVEQYRMHDLVREYAVMVAERDEAATATDAAVTRLLDHWLAAVNFATHRIDAGRTALRDVPEGARLPKITDRASAMAWFDAHRHHVKAVVIRAHAVGRHRHAWKIASWAATYYQNRKHFDDWLTTHRTGLEAARALADKPAQALLYYRLINMFAGLGEVAAAQRYSDEALPLTDELDDWHGRASILNSLGCLYSDRVTDGERSGDYQLSYGYLTQALEIYRQWSDRIGEAKLLANLGGLRRRAGERRQAVASLTAALALFRELERPNGEAFALRSLGAVYAESGDHALAQRELTLALRLAREHGSIETELDCLERLGNLCREQGRLDEAREWHTRLRAAVPDHYPARDRARMDRSIAETARAVGGEW